VEVRVGSMVIDEVENHNLNGGYNRQQDVDLDESHDQFLESV
jgi:hypothetical protein